VAAVGTVAEESEEHLLLPRGELAAVADVGGEGEQVVRRPVEGAEDLFERVEVGAARVGVALFPVPDAFAIDEEQVCELLL
jgi:hypothetical protein